MFTRRAIKNFILHRVNYQTVCLFVDTMLVNRTFLFVILLHFIFQDLTLCKFQPVYHLLPRLISQSLPRFFLFFFFLFHYLNSFLEKSTCTFRWTKQNVENNVLKFMSFLSFIINGIYIFISIRLNNRILIFTSKTFLMLHSKARWIGKNKETF